MANEIRATLTISVTKAGAKGSAAETSQFTMSGSDIEQGTQLIGTSAEAITIGEAANPGYIYLKNIDATNYVDVAMDSSVTTPFARLNPNDWLWLPAIAATYYAKAHTASVRVLKLITGA